MKNNQVLILMVAIALIAASCVSSKKFEQVNTELNQLKTLTAEQEEIINYTEKELATNESKNKTLVEENSKLQKDMKVCTEAKEAVSKNLNALNGAIKEQHGSLQQLNDKAKADLQKFEAAGIDVKFVDGLVHLSMDNGLMFISGGATVGWEGKQVLAVVADAVNDFPGTSVYVIGNTDNVPAGKGYKDNWSLSTTRANAVVRVLSEDFKVDPARIISGGRSQYHPVEDNTTDEGKMKNRRIDIFINPNLEKLWKTAETIK
jgi:chemotaxis protein MotB